MKNKPLNLLLDAFSAFWAGLFTIFFFGLLSEELPGVIRNYDNANFWVRGVADIAVGAVVVYLYRKLPEPKEK